MRTNRNPRLRAGLLALAILASSMLPALVSATPANANPACQPGGVYIVFARGSGAELRANEARVFGDSLDTVLNLIAPSVPRKWAELGNLDTDRSDGQFPNDSDEYPAVPVNDWHVLPWVYGPSVETGTNELVNHLNERASRPVSLGCQHEAIVLGGYSQGADVIGWALARDGSDGRVSLSTEAKRRIGFVALYGDPKFNCSGSWVRGNVPCTVFPDVQGVLGRRNPYLPNDFTGRVGSWCDAGDAVCTGNLLFAVFGGGTHGSIYRESLIDSSSAEIAVAALVKLNELNASAAQVVLSAYVDTNGHALPAPPPPPHPWATATTSTTTQQYGGDYNGDGYGDVAMLHKNGSGGIDIHTLYGGMGTGIFQNVSTFRRVLPGPTWPWENVKVVAGRFNPDHYADLALFFLRGDGGADVYILWGGPQPFTQLDYVRSLSAGDGWDWSLMKLVSGDFNGDWLDDVAIGHKVADGGIGVHVLLGSAGISLRNGNTFVRQLPGSQGWNWNLTQLAAGQFNNDDNADLVVVHQASDGGVDLHILNGSTGGAVFANSSTILRHLAASNGWHWNQIKVAAGAFNGDGFADIALLHQVADGGIGVHVVYGAPNPFQNESTFARQLPGYDGWSWAGVKVAAGMFNSDGYSDVALLHSLPDNGIHAHVLYGQVGADMFGGQYPSLARGLLTSDGWNWGLVKTN